MNTLLSPPVLFTDRIEEKLVGGRGKKLSCGCNFDPIFFLLLVSGNIWNPVLECNGAEYVSLLAYIPGMELFSFIGFMTVLKKQDHQESQLTKNIGQIFYNT